MTETGAKDPIGTGIPVGPFIGVKILKWKLFFIEMLIKIKGEVFNNKPQLKP
jgi:hypothetical protein